MLNQLSLRIGYCTLHGHSFLVTSRILELKLREKLIKDRHKCKTFFRSIF
uniref:Uncharacterized protein n=1 Tax=Physcomitrium patens TaxID=3218 RepID=A0A2K1KMB3_PHYPA|nr:hypothetical protein PHYPA_005806 [Physcomitrium patens]